MKKMIALIMTLMLMLTLSACGAEETPVVQYTAEPSTQSTTAAISEEESPMPWDLLDSAVSVEIGLNDNHAHSVTMYDNDAALTMLDYLSSSQMRFPTYTYEEGAGFVSQYIRGNYDRRDEMTIADIHAGDLYLFSDGVLRLYFKDVSNANIVATPVGYFTDREMVTEEVMNAYYENLNDVWGVSVYFLITKTMEW